jgi:hypothetical protein
MPSVRGGTEEKRGVASNAGLDRTSCDSKAVRMSMLSIGLTLAIRAALVLLFSSPSGQMRRRSFSSSPIRRSNPTLTD